MNFDFTDEQKLLKDEARKFLNARSSLSVARAVLNDPTAGFDAALWRQVGEQGLQGGEDGWCRGRRIRFVSGCGYDLGNRRNE